jgi:hypothetical protein
MSQNGSLLKIYQDANFSFFLLVPSLSNCLFKLATAQNKNDVDKAGYFKCAGYHRSELGVFTGDF